MSERKNKMIELGEAFIAFPGGTGTLEEIAAVSYTHLDVYKRQSKLRIHNTLTCVFCQGSSAN